MTTQHRTRPPTTAWHKPFRIGSDDIEVEVPWESDIWPIPLTNKITSRLLNSLRKVDTLRFLRSTLGEWSDKDDWQCWRFLGSGGYAHVAMWRKLDKDGTLLDEVALKEETKCIHRTARDVTGEKYHLAAEATHLNTINRRELTDNIVFLRGFKSLLKGLAVPRHVEVKPNKEIWRFYLEYAPYGNLHDLTMRYKAFHRYLPELFLWHVFDSLARAVAALETQSESYTGDFKHFWLHLDIKPQNIFLGYEGTRSRDSKVTGGLDGEVLNYPTVKLGDFGLTRYNTHDRRAVDFRLCSTRGYQAPELQQYQPNLSSQVPDPQYGADWDSPINKADDMITSKANIWAIGKVMYNAFSLSHWNEYDCIKASSRDEYEEYGGQPIKSYDEVPFARDELNDSSPYSQALSDLIERCMSAEPWRRPSGKELYQLTHLELEKRQKIPHSKLLFSVRNPKLYYRGNEINNMSIEERNCRHILAPHEYVSLLAPQRNDPDDPVLDIYPEQFWEWFEREEDQEDTQYHLEKALLEDRSDFKTILERSEEMVKIGQRDVEFFDINDDLTYNGEKTDADFTKEYRHLVPGKRGHYSAHELNDPDVLGNLDDEDDVVDDEDDANNQDAEDEEEHPNALTDAEPSIKSNDAGASRKRAQIEMDEKSKPAKRLRRL